MSAPHASNRLRAAVESPAEAPSPVHHQAPWPARNGAIRSRRRPARAGRFLLTVLIAGVALTSLGIAHASAGWQTGAPSLDPARTSLAAATAPCPSATATTCLYAVGGLEGSAPVGTVEYYDPSAGTGGSWQTAPSLNTARYQLNAATAPCPSTTVGAPSGATCLYAIGGFDISGNPQPTVEYYDPSTGTGGSWETNAPSLNTTRYDFAASAAPCPATTPGTPSTTICLYAMGGRYINGDILHSVEYYDPTTGTGGNWQTLYSTLITRRYNFAAAAAPCPSTTTGAMCIYAMGGDDVNSAVVADVEYYDPSTGTYGGWQFAPSLNAVRDVLAATGAPCPSTTAATPSPATCLYAIGGRDSTGAVLPSVEYYDPSTGTGGTWRTDAPPLNTARYHFAAATAPCPSITMGVPALTSCIYAVDGTDSSLATSDNVEYYDPSTRGGTTVAPLRGGALTHHNHRITFHWTAASQRGIVGFTLTAHGHPLTAHLIPVHRSHLYRYTAVRPGSGPYVLHTILTSGREIVTPLG